MKKKIIKYFPNIILLITIIIMAFVFIYSSFFVRINEDIRLSLSVPSSAKEGWVDMSTGDFVKENRISIEPGDNIVISHIIPYSYSSNPYEFSF